MQDQHTYDAVFEGGGVKGIGLVGAISVIEQQGYIPYHLAGTSAGAIIATLFAAGYTAAELRAMLMDLDFAKLTDTAAFTRIPGLAQVYDLAEVITELGIYAGDYFLNFMREKLAAKHISTFRDLMLPGYAADDKKRFTLQVIASDITRGCMLELPQDIADYGQDPEDLEVAPAVRMSMSIPLFFRPVKQRLANGVTCLIVDGGLLSDFPVRLFYVVGIPRWPTFGFRLSANASPHIVRHPIGGPLSEVAALFFTAMEANDSRYVEDADFVRTIAIDTQQFDSTDFTLNQADKETLYQSGVATANEFLATWDFDKYIARYRSGDALPSRRERLLP